MVQRREAKFRKAKRGPKGYMPRCPKVKSDVCHVTQNMCLQGDLDLPDPMSVSEPPPPVLLPLHWEIPA